MRTGTGWACRNQPGRERETSSNQAHMGEPIQALWDSSPSVSGPARHGGKASEVRSETDAALHSHLAISHAMA